MLNMAMTLALVCLMAAGAALSLRHRFPVAVQIAGLIIISIGGLELVVFLYGLTGISAIFSPALAGLFTAVGLISLGVFLLWFQGRQGLLALLQSKTISGKISRRLLPLALLIPFILGWLHMLGERAELYNSLYGTALLVVSIAATFVAVIYWICISLLSVEEALRQSERNYRIVADNTQTWEFWAGPDGKFLYSSPSCERLTGYRAAEFLADRDLVSRIVYEADRELFEQHRENSGQGERVAEAEFRIVRKDGAVRWITHVCQAVYDNKGNFLGVRGSNRDVTERKQAEENVGRLNRELQQRNAELDLEKKRWQAVVTSIADEVWVCDEQGRMSLINIKAVTQMGLKEFRDRPVEEVLTEVEILNPDGQVRPPDQSPLLRSLKGEVAYGEEIMRHRESGRVRYRHYTSAPIKNTEGRITGAVAIARDITQRKQMEEALRLSEERLRATFENAALGIFEADAENRFTAVNARICQMLGCEKELLLGKSVAELTAPQDRAAARTRHSEMCAGRYDRLDFETHYIKAGGALLISHTTLSVLHDSAGHFQRIIGTIEDISERKHAEQERLRYEAQLQRVQRLESIGILAGGIAHDFNNLLAGLFGYLEVARVAAERRFFESIPPTLEQAFGALSRARNLTQQLLTFSKGGGPAKKSTQLEALLRDAINFALSGSAVVSELSVPDDLWCCEVDPDQLTQAIDNILLNAKEAMPAGGRVTIGAENVSDKAGVPEPLPAGKYVQIWIRDDGPGIPREVLEHVFDPFFTTKNSGHGLGLAIAYSVAKKHGGLLTGESEPGKGATFRLYIPASARPAESEKRKPALVPEAQACGRILIVDDEPMIAQILGAMLKEKGYAAESAARGEDALRLYRDALADSRPYAAVILDLTIKGGLGGKDTIQELLRIDPAVIGIVSSGYSNDPIIANPQAYGFKAALGKPFRAAELYEVLQGALRGARATPPAKACAGANPEIPQ